MSAVRCTDLLSTLPQRVAVRCAAVCRTARALDEEEIRDLTSAEFTRRRYAEITNVAQ